MTDDDLVKAREAERVMREYAAHPSSFTVPDSEQARSVADTIAALLDEMEALASIVNSPIVHEERNKLEAEIEALKAERDNLRRTLGEHIRAADSEIDALALDAARYREFVVSGGWHRHIDGEHPEESYSYLVVGLPVDADLSCYAARKLAMDKVLDEGSER